MAGEVSSLFKFPFLRTTTLKEKQQKKTVPDRAATASLVFTAAKSAFLSCAPPTSRLPQALQWEHHVPDME